MKQINIKIILLMLVLSSNSNIIFAQFGGGNGTELSPYQIRTRQHIEELCDSINSGVRKLVCFTHNKCFKLMNDITDSVRCVIGESYAHSEYGDTTGAWNNFCTAHFDGQNHKITLAIVSNGHASLFGTAFRSTIKNLRVDGYVKKNGNNGRKGMVFDSYSASGIVGYAYDTYISNCVNYANIYINYTGSASVGGIVGEFLNRFMFLNRFIKDYYISNCVNFGNIEVASESHNQNHVVGGIVGKIYQGHYYSITNCINYGTLKYHFQHPYVYGHYDNPGLGGILGKHISSNFTNAYYAKIYGITQEIKNCINVGFIDGPGGGIVGTLVEKKDTRYDYAIISNELIIKNCTNAGFITGPGGGIVGGTVSADTLKGGLINRLTIENCINTGVIGNSPKSSGIVHIED